MHALLLLLECHRALHSLVQADVEVVWNFCLHLFIHALIHYVCKHFWPLLAPVELNLLLDGQFRDIGNGYRFYLPLSVVQQLLRARMRRGVVRVERRVFRHADLKSGIERLPSLRLLTIRSEPDTVFGFLKAGHLTSAIYHNLVFIAHEVAGPVGAHRILDKFLICKRRGRRLLPTHWLGLLTSLSEQSCRVCGADEGRQRLADCRRWRSYCRHFIIVDWLISFILFEVKKEN